VMLPCYSERFLNRSIVPSMPRRAYQPLPSGQAKSPATRHRLHGTGCAMIAAWAAAPRSACCSSSPSFDTVRPCLPSVTAAHNSRMIASIDRIESSLPGIGISTMSGSPSVSIRQTVGMPSDRASRRALCFAADVDDDHRAGQLVHVANAFEVAGNLPLLAQQLRFHLLGVAVDLAGFDQPFEFLKPLESLADGAEVGQRAAQPAFGDVGHADVFGVLLDGAARLPLGADEAHVLALSDGPLDELLRQQQTLDGLADVDDVNLVARRRCTDSSSGSSCCGAGRSECRLR
jgi:hypothetical protein